MALQGLKAHVIAIGDDAIERGCGNRALDDTAVFDLRDYFAIWKSPIEPKHDRGK